MPSTLQQQDRFHVALIMDGNGRWAGRRGLPRSAGHRAGARALRAIVEAAPELGISTLTVFAFSSDNWKRPPGEVAALMSLLRTYLRSEAKRFVESGARLSIIGRLDRLPAQVAAMIRRCERLTRDGSRLSVRIAIDYSARDAIVRAAKMLGARDSITREDFGRTVGVTAGGEVPASAADSEVDLIIRTGGEKRLSDFMLWEAAYAELIFTDVMWPDFGPEHLRTAVQEFHQRARRFGGINCYAENENFARGASDEKARHPIERGLG